jgi:curved DNA-binding protein CbpA
MTDERDPYAILGVPPGASAEQIASAYRRLARQHHPDVSGMSGAEQRMAEINAAWTLLRDPAKRAAWDAEHGARFGSDRPNGGYEPDAGTTGVPWPTTVPRPRTATWRRGPAGEGAAGPPPGNPRGSVLPFGRHIGWSLGEIARIDPGYLTWLASRPEGAPYRAEISDILAGIRPATADAGEPKKRGLFR